MRLNELLGIEFPFIQGGMANIATAEFAAAVSNAGALGLIGAGGMSPEVFQDSIRRCRTLTEKPFGVNIMLMHPQVEQLAAIAAQEKVAVVTTGAGDPARFIPAWKESGAKVFPVVPAVALAKVVARAGADAVIAEGTESGGRRGGHPRHCRRRHRRRAAAAGRLCPGRHWRSGGHLPAGERGVPHPREL